MSSCVRAKTYIWNCKNLGFHMRAGDFGSQWKYENSFKHFNFFKPWNMHCVCFRIWPFIQNLYTAYFHAFFNLGRTYCILSLLMRTSLYLVSKYIFLRWHSLNLLLKITGNVTEVVRKSVYEIYHGLTHKLSWNWTAATLGQQLYQAKIGKLLQSDVPFQIGQS